MLNVAIHVSARDPGESTCYTFEQAASTKASQLRQLKVCKIAAARWYAVPSRKECINWETQSCACIEPQHKDAHQFRTTACHPLIRCCACIELRNTHAQSSSPQPDRQAVQAYTITTRDTTKHKPPACKSICNAYLWLRLSAHKEYAEQHCEQTHTQLAPLTM